MGPNSTTLTFAGTPEIAGVYDDTSYYKAVIRSNSALPKWLTFNSPTREFSGKPAKDGELQIVLIAKNTTKHFITDEFKITIQGTTGIMDKNIGNDLTIYPNPAKDFLKIDYKGDNQNIKFELIDLSGKIMKQGRLNNNSFDISGFEKGIYILKLSINGEIIEKKVSLQ